MSHVDLAATLAARAGLTHADSRCDLLDESRSTSAVCSELRIRRRYFQAMRSAGWKLIRQYKFETAADCEAFTRFEEPSGQPPVTHCQLYDLAADARERRDLFDDARGSAARRRLIAELDSWSDDIRSRRLAGVGCEVEIDDGVVQRLRDLGYLD